MPDARDIGIRQSFQSSLLGEEKLEMVAGFAADATEGRTSSLCTAVARGIFRIKCKGRCAMAAALDGYSLGSLRIFFCARLRARACFTRSFAPGFR